MIPLSVELVSRGEASDVMDLLSRYHPWTVQLGPERWVVVGRADAHDHADAAVALVTEWALVRGRTAVECVVGSDPGTDARHR